MARIVVDGGMGMGLKRVGAGPSGSGGGAVGVAGGIERVKRAEEWKSGKLAGDRAFAKEYREVKLKLKLDIGRKRHKKEEEAMGTKTNREGITGSDTILTTKIVGERLRGTSTTKKKAKYPVVT